MLTMVSQRELLDDFGVDVFPATSQIVSPDEKASDNEFDNEDLEDVDSKGNNDGDATSHALSIGKIE